MSGSPFQSSLRTKIAISGRNHFDNNVDWFRFPNGVRQTLRHRIRLFVVDLTPLPLLRVLLRFALVERLIYGPMYRRLKELEEFYSLLNDDRSRDLLVNIAAFRILGHKKVQLPLGNGSFMNSIEELNTTKSTGSTSNSSGDLSLFDLTHVNYPLRIRYNAHGIVSTFLFKHYDYGTIVRAEPGDVVLDLGGCLGDTALYFSHLVGPDGKVYSFEFIPSNATILRSNVELNLPITKNVQVVDQPVWEVSGKRLYYIDQGPASKLFDNPNPKASGTVETISIDDFVENNFLTRVDFIKMDIEGAEPNALKGALRSIRTHRPKLAISIYHNLNDFVGIIAFIHSLGLDYNFYLNHCSIHAEETVLFAIAK